MEGVSPVDTASWMTGCPKTVSALGARAGNLPRAAANGSCFPDCQSARGRKREREEPPAAFGRWGVWGEGKGNNRSVLECGCRKTKLSGKERGKIDSIRSCDYRT